jgi:DNA-nicking Smr family endonuclease
MRKKDESKKEDDAALWNRVTSQIKPIKSVRYKQPVGLGTKAAAVKQRKNAKNPAKPKSITMSPPPISAAPMRQPVDLRNGDHAGIDKTSRRKLSRGNLPVEARLDLHGSTAIQAERRLRDFLIDQAHHGSRCVLVITGKGADGEGVLRRHVPLWLKQRPLADLVLAISTAAPKDGGAGAMYVLLRRARASK